MKRESIEKIETEIMNLIYNSDIDSKDKTELMIVLGHYLENYSLEKYFECCKCEKNSEKVEVKTLCRKEEK